MIGSENVGSFEKIKMSQSRNEADRDCVHR